MEMRILAPLAVAVAAFGLAAPAQGSGGVVCRTAGARSIDLRLVISHTAVSSVVSARLIDGGRDVPVAVAQSWLDPSDIRVDLVDRNAQRHELRLRARKNGRVYDGTLWRGGSRHWVRCRED
jgi:hypothetical protein